MTLPPSRDRQTGAAVLAVVIAIAAVVLALVVTINALSAYRMSTALQRWDEALGSWDEVMQRYPAREVNASALELERLAADLGIDIVTRSSERHDSLTGKPHDRIDRELQDAFYDYSKVQTERIRLGELDAPPAILSAYIEANNEGLLAVRRHLVNGDVPLWESDLSWAEAAPIPNLLGHMKLQRLLASVALARLHAGDSTGALADVEAAWRLSQSLNDSPILINQLILMAGTRYQLGVLRQIRDVDEIWTERLAQHDFRESFITAMKFEGWFWLHYSESSHDEYPLPAWQRVATPLTTPYTQLCLADLSDKWRERLLNLEQVDALCDRDLAPYGADMDIPVPRWNLVGEFYIPNLLGAIGRLARLELDQELTLLSIDADAKRRANGGVWPESFLAERDSTACPDDRWNYRLADEELQIALSRDVTWPGQKGAILPTRVALN